MQSWMRLRTVLVVALLLRIAVPVSAMAVTHDKSVFYCNDTAMYVITAAEMLAYGTFTTSHLPEISRTPGFPALLLPGLQLGHLEWVTIALQILLSCCTVYLVYRLARTLFGRPRVAWWCALFYAVDPLSVVSASVLETETLFTWLTLLWLWLLCRYLQRGARSVSLVVRASVILAASAYVRPIAFFLPWVTAGALGVWAVQRGQAIRRGLLHAGLLLVISAGLIGLWQVRNTYVAGYPGFSTISSTNLYFYQGASVLARQTGIYMHEVQHRLGYHDEDVYLAAHPEQRDWSPGQRMQWAGREGWRILASAPMTYASLHVEGMVRLLFDPCAVNVLKLYKQYPRVGGLLDESIDRGLLVTFLDLRRTMPLVFWSNVMLGFVLGGMLCFACVAVLSGEVRSRHATQLAVLTAVYFLVISGGPQSFSRFRHPMMPVICLLAGYGVWKTRAWAADVGRQVPQPQTSSGGVALSGRSA